MENNKAQIIYFSHGGGPLPILGDSGHIAMNAFMHKLPDTIRTPKAIVVFSAHWEESVATIQSNPSPKMVYDYYGFPEEAYSITYPSKGNPPLANKISKILSKHEIKNKLDDDRGYDHGLYIPLKMMYPNADIPSIQISLLNSLDEKAHLNLGMALRDLLQEEILIIGSGFSFHNLREFSFGGENTIDSRNEAFQDWLIETITMDITESERKSKLVEWEKAPNARYCHPRSEHLLPLHVCAGAAGTKGEVIFDDYIAGKRSVAFLWE